MEELDRFEALILAALGNVDESYYRTTYYNIQNFRAALQHRAGQIVGNDFERYGERVFCYEFYHQLRILVDSERRDNPNFLQPAILQGEVEKMQIIELVDRFGLEDLNGEYAPDFLMHTPGNASLHPCVIEVKCSHNVSRDKVLTDIAKINEFITRYQYQRGVFITANTDRGYIEAILDRITPDINEYEGRGRIKVICKTNQNAEPIVWQL